ncbi:MAG: 50S ribosomal protein L21 [Solirubrobacterales bacterium]|nr:50S ribosomal protein L21 [Solirubrobacterales bacterium]
MYAIVKTGGKQYRVQQGESLLVERLPVGDGERVSLRPLLYVDGSQVVDAADELARVTVDARVLRHERGPKLRVVKFKPKRGYKRRTGHRQELTRVEVTEISFAGGSEAAAAAPETPPAEAAAEGRAAEGRAETPPGADDRETPPAAEERETPPQSQEATNGA